MRGNIQKAREDDNIPQIPLKREDIPVFLNKCHLSKSKEPILMFDNGKGDTERMFTFASEIDTRILSEWEHWFTDARFKVCPEVSLQLYTTFERQCWKIFPYIFGLSLNKAEATHNSWYNIVKQFNILVLAWFTTNKGDLNL